MLLPGDDVDSSSATDVPPVVGRRPLPEREGLPAGFRMRADAHYVEQLDAGPAASLRTVDIDAIQTGTAALEPALPSLVDSVRKHGVLEPLLVQHDRRRQLYRLIAGRRRLAAARAAALTHVPCVLHAISDAQAAELTETLRRSTAPSESRASAPPGPISAAPIERELDATLNGIASAVALLAASSTSVRTGAAELVRIECRRALRLLTALRVVQGEWPVRKVPILASLLVTRAAQAIQEEHRGAGVGHEVRVASTDHVILNGNDELLFAAICNAVASLDVAADARQPRNVALSLVTDEPAMASIDVHDAGLRLPQSWTASAFDEPWPVDKGAAAMTLLRAVREIARWHGGTASMAADDDGARVRITLPIARDVVT